MSEKYEHPTYELPFPVSEYKDRLRRLRKAMDIASIDVKIISNPRDLYWLTGTRINSETSFTEI